MRNVIAIIPARSGSKRIPNKNIAEFVGKPMIAWTIEAALESGIFSDVLVSTDGEEIAELSRNFGASVPFLRNTEYADDFTPVSVATVSSLIQMEQHKLIHYDVVVQLMPNCPRRTADDIIDSYDNFLNSGADFQISVFRFGWMNPWWAMKLDEKTMRPIPIFPEAWKKRSQDMEKLYCPTGAVWIAEAKGLKEKRTFYGDGYKVFPLDWQNAVDIDDMDDLRMAEVLMLQGNKT
jgi:N-acylneuraminate cytidylyltransferase